MDFDSKTNYPCLPATSDLANQISKFPDNNNDDEELSYYSLGKYQTDVMLEIFSRVPPKLILRYKSLSKNFLDFTKQDDFITKQFDSTRDNIAGFFGLNYYKDEIRYMHVNSKLSTLPDPTLKFIMEKNNGDIIRLMDSCNGLLLCMNINSKSVKTCYVCNPFTGEKVVLPQFHRKPTWVYHALMADIDKQAYIKYKVVCLFKEKSKDERQGLLILSSETGEWEEIEADFPPIHHPHMMGSKVFFNGSLFWDCFETKILVCHLNTEISGFCFELIESPHAPLGRCLWKFHEKLLCYCHNHEGDFPAWSLSKENRKFEKVEGYKQFEIMSEDISRRNLENSLIKPFEIIAYDPEFSMVYFVIKDSFYSYKLWSREVDRVGKFGNSYNLNHKEQEKGQKFQWKTCVVAYRPILVPIQDPVKGKANEEEQETDIMEKDSLLESIQEKDDELASMYENCANKVKPTRKKARRKKVENKEKGGERDKQEKNNLLEGIEKNNDEFASSLEENYANIINFNFLRLDEE